MSAATLPWLVTLDGLPVSDMTQDVTALIAHFTMRNGPHVAQRSTLIGFACGESPAVWGAPEGRAGITRNGRVPSPARVVQRCTA
jgi:hypothetical protein